jgi:hypothetical protein
VPLLVQTHPCASCGRPVDLAQPYWEERGAHLHLKCVPWHEREFPYAGDILWLVDRYREAKLKLDVVTRAGKWLRAAIKRWPEGAADAVRDWPGIRRGVESALAPPERRGRREER